MSRKNLFTNIIPAPTTFDESADSEKDFERPPVQKAGVVSGLSRSLEYASEEHRQTKEAHKKAQSELEETRRELQALKDQGLNGQNVQEIDPALVDPSPIRDRLDNPSATDSESLRLSIQENGQRVPALLRPNPKADGRYLTVFGHRRVAAVTALGLRLRAIVVEMSDEDAFVAQGQENNERENTSFIERCVFAQRLKAYGMRGVQIASAIATDRTTVSKMIDIAERVPDDIVAAIGPAPSVGRPRWQNLADIIGPKKAACRKLIQSDDFISLGSDDRFQAVYSAAAAAAPKSVAAANFSPLADREGKQFAQIKRSPAGELTMKISKDDGSVRQDGRSFGEWLESRMSSLRDEWLDGQ